MQNADDVIQRALIDGDSAMPLLYDEGNNIFDAGLELDADDLGARRHDLTGRDPRNLHDLVDHLLLFLLQLAHARSLLHDMLDLLLTQERSAGRPAASGEANHHSGEPLQKPGQRID
jgi:hypothetical protein